MYSRAIRHDAVAFIASGHTIAEASRHFGIPGNSIYRWLRGGIEAKPGASSELACFRCQSEHPPDPDGYTYLLGLYLGDGCISNAPRPGVFILRISCADALPGLMDACEEAMGILGTKVHRIARIGCHELV